VVVNVGPLNVVVPLAVLLIFKIIPLGMVVGNVNVTVATVIIIVLGMLVIVVDVLIIVHRVDNCENVLLLVQTFVSDRSVLDVNLVEISNPSFPMYPDIYYG
jgi:hypothetical protein